MHYLSPYRIQNLNGPFTVEDDLFALGVSIWELYTEKRPFQGMTSGQAREMIRPGRTVDVEEIGDEEAVQVVQELMSHMLLKSIGMESSK
jgi:hypothetical protein